MDTKETMEVLDGALKVIEQYKLAMEDGSIGVMDIPKLVPIFWAVKNAFEGAGLISAEIKDLDQAEVAELFAKMALIVNEVVSILKPQE